MPEPAQRTSYVASVIEAYRRTPGTLGKVRPADRRLAGELYDHNVPLAIVKAALCLAAARRAGHPASTPSFGPIRSLHYVKPVIAELLDHPPDPAYLAYLEARLAPTREPAPTRPLHST